MDVKFRSSWPTVWAVATAWTVFAGAAFASHRPTIVLVVSATAGPAPLTVQFDAAKSSDSDGPIDRFEWTFGDGTGGTGATTAHQFVVPGEFIVMLNVVDGQGDSARAFVSIKVSERTTPLASFAYSVTGDPREIRFDASLSRGLAPLYHRWDFGDGTEPVGCAPRSFGPSASPRSPGPTTAPAMVPPNIPRPFARPRANDRTHVRPIIAAGRHAPSGPASPAPREEPHTCPSPFDHVFPAPGLYQVTLRVTDGSRATHQLTRTVPVFRGHAVDPIPLEGVTGGSPAGSRVFRLSLDDWAAQAGASRLGTIAALDDSPIDETGALAAGQFSGGKVDAISIADAACDDVVCAALLPPDLSTRSWRHIFVPGEMTDGGVDFFGYGTLIGTSMSMRLAAPTLFGTRDGDIDGPVATLGDIDANATRVHPHGFLSVGFGGAVVTNFSEALDPSGRFLYLAALKEKWSRGQLLLYEDVLAPEELFDLEYRRTSAEADARATVIEPTRGPTAATRVVHDRTTAVTVQNAAADTVQLLLPSQALPVHTAVLLSLVDLEVPGLVPHRLYAAFKAATADQQFAQRATLLVSRTPGKPFSPRALVYALKADRRLVALPRQRRQDGVLHADAYRGGTFVVADIDALTFRAIVDREPRPPARASGATAALDASIASDLAYASQAQLLGHDDEYNAVMNDLSKTVSVQVRDAMVTEPGTDPCEVASPRNLELLQTAQLLDVENDLVRAFEEFLGKNQASCFRDGSLSYAGELIWPGCPNLRVAFEEPLPFHLEGDRLTGGGLASVNVDWSCHTLDGVFGIVARAKSQIVLQGEASGLAIRFEPPVSTGGEVTLKFLGSGQVVMTVAAHGSNGVVDVVIGVLGFGIVSARVAAEPQAYPQPLIFAPMGGTFRIPRTQDGITVIDSWTLQRNRAPRPPS